MHTKRSPWCGRQPARPTHGAGADGDPAGDHDGRSRDAELLELVALPVVQERPAVVAPQPGAGLPAHVARRRPSRLPAALLHGRFRPSLEPQLRLSAQPQPKDHTLVRRDLHSSCHLPTTNNHVLEQRDDLRVGTAAAQQRFGAALVQQSARVAAHRAQLSLGPARLRRAAERLPDRSQDLLAVRLPLYSPRRSH